MNKTTLLTGTIISVMSMACASTPKRNEGVYTKNPNAPDWVARGSISKKAKIYGVGSARGIRKVALARSTAESRARAEVSKILEVYSASLMKDYQASTNAGGPESSEEQHTEQAIKTFAANLLKGTTIGAVWFDPTQDAYFALAELNIEDMKKFSSLEDSANQEADLEQMAIEMRRPAPANTPSSEHPASDVSTSASDVSTLTQDWSAQAETTASCGSTSSKTHNLSAPDSWDEQRCINRKTPNIARGPFARL